MICDRWSTVNTSDKPEWNKKIASDAKRKKAHRDNQRRVLVRAGNWWLQSADGGPCPLPALPPPLHPLHSSELSPALPHLPPCSSTWELPFCVLTQFRKWCSSVRLSNCFVDAILVFAPRRLFPLTSIGPPPHSTSLVCCPIWGWENLLKEKFWNGSENPGDNPHLQLPLSPPCQTSPVTSGRVISKSLV